MNCSNNLRLLKLTHVGASEIRAMTGSASRSLLTAGRRNALCGPEGEMYPYAVGLLFLDR